MSDLDHNEEIDELTQVSMNVLIHAGNARDYLVKSLKSIHDENFEEANDYLKKAREEVTISHSFQTSTIQKEAMGEQIRYSILFAHAQDTMMTAQSEILIAENLIAIFEKLMKK
ncbi:PTS lactose/cellobiose transporter subunit IIA [Ornithinibacillus bavariensis]|uniref:PTS lactose transporter subunit IIA n=1 Tax=Ornithinibacillus bavariensis TaxID=545502 RepID=A0A920C786_9BACI|nr:PTS lactose/cellobiose transporter subunit IIA [Ornithinibacillus bavariensis]GIO27403.1 PTS lactose transporter subunit IIA [Ornithinibacillus bavariensis]HAM82001.1 PTS lactose/cellobiose transporter subunit IIA [Ornithinibacillus sp.]